MDPSVELYGQFKEKTSCKKAGEKNREKSRDKKNRRIAPNARCEEAGPES